MAGAKPGVHVVQLKPIVVPKSLEDGAKCVKWDDDSTVGTAVTLRVDKRGFFLYWTDQNKEVEYLDIATIRDTRTGRQARVPKDAKLRDTVNMGAQDTALEDKTFTVVYGNDLVNVYYINFCCNCREVAKEWTDEVLKMAYNLLALNASATTFLEKAYIKLTLQIDKDGKIPVKNIIKMFAQSKDDKRRVENALELTGFPAGKNDHITPTKFTYEDFRMFYKNLTNRQEVEKIFDKLCGGVKKKNNHLTAEQLVEFVNGEQRDPRLNEILYPYVTTARAKDIIFQYEPNKSLAQKGQLSVDGFLRYLMSDDNAIVAPEKFDLNADMNQPLSHYFINSSHNTYLTGHQLTGKSSVEMYRQCLLAGCRCIELDCWNGHTSEEEPIITHGYTVVTEISFKEVAEAIADSAFKTSEYPVILSFENHCSAKQQAKMAMYCSKIFGDMLLSEPFPSHPLSPGVALPSPNCLLRKIIVKNKKKHHHRGAEDKKLSTASAGGTSISGGSGDKPAARRLQKTNSKDSGGEPALNGDDVLSAPNGDLKDFDSSSESDDDDEGSCADDQRESTDKEQGTASQESEAGVELSALVNYIQPIHFHGFEVSEKRNRSYEISSFVETAATTLLKEHPVEFVNYNKRQLSRIYPKGTRVDSSNYMPQVFWNAGCQLVALNFQSNDLALQLNLGIFEYNGRSGYLLKPDFMRRNDRRFDPFAESTVDGIIAGALHVKIISGQFLTDKKVGTYVEVETYGLPADTCRKGKFKTKVVPGNGLNPIYDEEPFVLNKVVLPELAVIRFAVYEEGGKLIGHRILPFVGLRPGFRHLSLRNEAGQPLVLPTLFVHIVVKDYVPEILSVWADALTNPIKFLSEEEKRTQQLSALTDDFDEDLQEKGSPQAKISGPQTPVKVAIQPNNSFDNPASPKETSVTQFQQTASPGGLKRQDTGGKSGSPRTNTPMTSSSREAPAPDQAGAPSEFADRVIVAEPLENIKKDSKLVKDMLAKLEKDLQSLYKKHEKAVSREQELKLQREEKLTQGSQEGKKSTLAKTHSRLIKKFSKTNVYAHMFNKRFRRHLPPPESREALDAVTQKRQSEAEFSEGSVEQATKLQELQRSHSETLINLFKDLHKAELDLREKYHEPLHNAYEKAMLTAQAAQMKELQIIHENEKLELMKRLDAVRAEEIKALKKNSRDKNELGRMRREIRQRHIDQAVNEISKLVDILEKKRKDLELQHEEVRKKFEEEKLKAVEKLQRDYKQQCDRVGEECAAYMTTEELSSSRDVTSL